MVEIITWKFAMSPFVSKIALMALLALCTAMEGCGVIEELANETSEWVDEKFGETFGWGGDDRNSTTTAVAATTTRMIEEVSCRNTVIVEPGTDKLQAVVEKLRCNTNFRSSNDCVAKVQQVRCQSGTPSSVEVVLKPGFHFLTAPLELGRQDSNLRFRGENGAVISGGRVLSGWRKLPRGVRCGTSTSTSELWEAKIPYGFDASSIGRRMQLWRGKERLQLAASKMLTYTNGIEESNQWYKFFSQIKFKNSDIRASYCDMKNVHLVMYASWTATHHQLESVNVGSRIARFKNHFRTVWRHPGNRYYVENAFEELDEDGEFYVDIIGRRVLLKLRENPNYGPDIVLAGPKTLLYLNGHQNSRNRPSWRQWSPSGKAKRQSCPLFNAQLHDVSFHNIEFAHTAVEQFYSIQSQAADFLLTAMAHVRFAQNVIFSSCTFRNVGGYAVWFEEQAHDCQVVDSSLLDLGAGGVRLGRGHITAHEGCDGESRGHSIVGNEIADGGLIWQEAVGILAQNVHDVKLKQNEIRSFRYTGISMGWTWRYDRQSLTRGIVAEFNRIHQIGLGYLSDLACIYTLGHQPGSRVYNNYCSDVQSYKYGGWGIYTDQASRGITFENNVVTRTQCAGFHQHYGTDITILNNVFHNVNIGDIRTPGRQEIFMHKWCHGESSIHAATYKRDLNTCPNPDTNPKPGCCCHEGCTQGLCSNWHFERNIVVANGEEGCTQGVCPLVTTYFEGGLNNFTFANNLYYLGGRPSTRAIFDFDQKTFATWKRRDQGSFFDDPRLTWQPDIVPMSSPAVKKLGFQPFSLRKVGPQSHVGAQS